MTPIYARNWTIVIILSMLSGCTVTSAPQARVIDQRQSQATDDAVRVEFVMQVHNPNDVQVELRELNYRVQMGGRAMYSGRRAAQATLPPRGDMQLVVPAVVPRDSLDSLESPASLRIDGSLSYLTPGALSQLLRDAGFPRARTRFAHDGSAEFMVE